MTTLDHRVQIRTWINERWDNDPGLTADALTAVLNIHQEYRAESCVACGRSYPCVTVQAIASALGITQEATDGN